MNSNDTMVCDECGKDSVNGTAREWVAATHSPGGSYQTATHLVFETLYGAFTPVSTFLCDQCYAPRGAKARRRSLLGFAGSTLFTILAFALSYNLWFWSCFAAGDIASSLSSWQVILGIASGIAAFLALKKVLREYGFGFGVMWQRGSDREIEVVHFPYALRKAKAEGRDTALSIELYETMQRVQSSL